MVGIGRRAWQQRCWLCALASWASNGIVSSEELRFGVFFLGPYDQLL
jgi:hypothetical protein